jgi:outer membrane protein OmpA-like peptidoglycan-associated protein
MAVISGALTLWVAIGALHQAETHPDRDPVTARPSASSSRSASGPISGAAGGRNSTMAGSPLTRLAVDRIEVEFLSDVLFDFNSARLKPDARAMLAAVITDARGQHRRGRVTVRGYTDDVGPTAYNLDLSRRRAATVAAYLEKTLGGEGMTFVSLGYGIHDPIATNATAAGQQRNRRVTIEFPQAGTADAAVTPPADAAITPPPDAAVTPPADAAITPPPGAAAA